MASCEKPKPKHTLIKEMGIKLEKSSKNIEFVENPSDLLSSLPSYHPLSTCDIPAPKWLNMRLSSWHACSRFTYRRQVAVDLPCRTKEAFRTDVIDSSSLGTGKWQGRLKSPRCLDYCRQLLDGSFSEIQHEPVYEDGRETGHGHDQHMRI